MANTLILYDGKLSSTERVANCLGMIIGNVCIAEISEAPEDISPYDGFCFIFNFYGALTAGKTRQYLTANKEAMVGRRIALVGMGFSDNGFAKYVVDMEEAVGEGISITGMFIRDEQQVFENGFLVARKFRSPWNAMDPGVLTEKIDAYIEAHTTLALASAGAGSVRCTPLEYNYHNGVFYIVTEGGLKFRSLLANDDISAAIFDPYDGSMAHISGLQFSGKAQIVDRGSDEYWEVLKQKHVSREACENLPVELFIVRIVPLRYEFLCSEFNEEGFDAKQSFDTRFAKQRWEDGVAFAKETVDHEAVARREMAEKAAAAEKAIEENERSISFTAISEVKKPYDSKDIEELLREAESPEEETKARAEDEISDEEELSPDFFLDEDDEEEIESGKALSDMASDFEDDDDFDDEFDDPDDDYDDGYEEEEVREITKASGEIDIEELRRLMEEDTKDEPGDYRFADDEYDDTLADDDESDEYEDDEYEDGEYEDDEYEDDEYEDDEFADDGLDDDGYEDDEHEDQGAGKKKKRAFSLKDFFAGAFGRGKAAEKKARYEDDDEYEDDEFEYEEDDSEADEYEDDEFEYEEDDSEADEYEDDEFEYEEDDSEADEYEDDEFEYEEDESEGDEYEDDEYEYEEDDSEDDEYEDDESEEEYEVDESEDDEYEDDESEEEYKVDESEDDEYEDDEYEDESEDAEYEYDESEDSEYEDEYGYEESDDDSEVDEEAGETGNTVSAAAGSAAIEETDESGMKLLAVDPAEETADPEIAEAEAAIEAEIAEKGAFEEASAADEADEDTADIEEASAADEADAEDVIDVKEVEGAAADDAGESYEDEDEDQPETVLAYNVQDAIAKIRKNMGGVKAEKSETFTVPEISKDENDEELPAEAEDLTLDEDEIAEKYGSGPDVDIDFDMLDEDNTYDLFENDEAAEEQPMTAKRADWEDAEKRVSSFRQIFSYRNELDTGETDDHTDSAGSDVFGNNEDDFDRLFGFRNTSIYEDDDTEYDRDRSYGRTRFDDDDDFEYDDEYSKDDDEYDDDVLTDEELDELADDEESEDAHGKKKGGFFSINPFAGLAGLFGGKKKSAKSRDEYEDDEYEDDEYEDDEYDDDEYEDDEYEDSQYVADADEDGEYEEDEYEADLYDEEEDADNSEETVYEEASEYDAYEDDETEDVEDTDLTESPDTVLSEDEADADIIEYDDEDKADELPDFDTDEEHERVSVRTASDTFIDDVTENEYPESASIGESEDPDVPEEKESNEISTDDDAYYSDDREFSEDGNDLYSDEDEFDEDEDEYEDEYEDEADVRAEREKEKRGSFFSGIGKSLGGLFGGSRRKDDDDDQPDDFDDDDEEDEDELRGDVIDRLERNFEKSLGRNEKYVMPVYQDTDDEEDIYDDAEDEEEVELPARDFDIPEITYTDPDSALRHAAKTSPVLQKDRYEEDMTDEYEDDDYEDEYEDDESVDEDGDVFEELEEDELVFAPGIRKRPSKHDSDKSGGLLSRLKAALGGIGKRSRDEYEDDEYEDDEYEDDEYEDDEYEDGEYEDGEYEDGEYEDGEYEDDEYEDDEYEDDEYEDDEYEDDEYEDDEYEDDEYEDDEYEDDEYEDDEDDEDDGLIGRGRARTKNANKAQGRRPFGKIFMRKKPETKVRGWDSEPVGKWNDEEEGVFDLDSEMDPVDFSNLSDRLVAALDDDIGDSIDINMDK